MYKDNSRIWWTLNKEEVGAAINSVTEWLLDQDVNRRRRYIKDLSLYKNTHVSNLQEFGTFGKSMLEFQTNPKMNVIRSMIDSVTAKITKQNPKPQILTSGGTPSEQSRAKNLDDYIYGTLLEQDVYKLAKELFREKAIFGSAVAKVFSKRNEKKKTAEIKIERVLPWELLIDPVDGKHGEPRAIIHVKYVSRELLLKKYPNKKGLIKSASNDDGANSFGVTDEERAMLFDLVRVIEAYKVSDNEKDRGRHVLCLDSGVLVDEDYYREALPFEVMHWNKPIMGYWGTAITHEAEGLQSEINELLNKISQAYYYHAIPTISVEKGTIDIKDLDNSLKGRIIQRKVGAAPPTMLTQAVISPEIYSHLDRIYQRVYEDVGVSQLQAQSKKPAGLDSGVAIREYNDIESARFVLQGVEYEQFFISLAYQIIDESKALAEAGYKIKAVAESKKNSTDSPLLKEIDFKTDADPRNNLFKVKIFPVSSLPQTPAGKLATVQALFSSGLIKERNQALSLLDYPDLNGELGLDTAPTEAVKTFISKMLEDGIYTPPDEYFDLGSMMTVAKQYYSLAVVKEWDEGKKQLIRTLIKQTKELGIKQAVEQQALAQTLQPQQQGGGQPGQPQQPQTNPQNPETNK